MKLKAMTHCWTGPKTEQNRSLEMVRFLECRVDRDRGKMVGISAFIPSHCTDILTVLKELLSVMSYW